MGLVDTHLTFFGSFHDFDFFLGRRGLLIQIDFVSWQDGREDFGANDEEEEEEEDPLPRRGLEDEFDEDEDDEVDIVICIPVAYRLPGSPKSKTPIQYYVLLAS